MLYKVCMILVLFLGITTSTFCVERSSFLGDLSVRERFESWNGMNAKNYGDNSVDAIGDLNDQMLLQRIIVGFKYKISDNLILLAHLQDSRAFGWSLRQSEYPDLFKIHSKDSQNPYYIKNPNEEYFEIYNLFIDYRNIIKGLSLKAGRQKIRFGDTRIFGPGQWGNSGSWKWDAIKLSYSNGLNSYNIWAGGTKINDPNQTNIPFTNTQYYGVESYNSILVFDEARLEPFFATKWQGSAEYIKEKNLNHYWLGVRFLDSNFYNFDYDLTFVKQFGNDNGKDIDAYGIAFRIGYKAIDIPGTPLLSLRYVYASGGETKDEINTFDPIYGSRDKYYGRMNIVKWSNLSDYEIALELFPLDKMWVELKYNYLSIPCPEIFSFGNKLELLPDAHHLGNELDVWVEYKKIGNFSFVLVGGYFIPADVKTINNKKVENASWLAFQITYSLIKGFM